MLAEGGESHVRVMIKPFSSYEILGIWTPYINTLIPEGDGYQAALVNFRFLANVVVSTDEAITVIKSRGLIKSVGK